MSSEKHNLQNKWTFWFDGFTNKQSQTYGTKILEIGKCETVERFWGIYEAIPKLSNIEVGSDISLFKNDIKPIWEEEEHIGGGRLTIILNNVEIDRCQQYWRDMLLTAIGETFPASFCINGIAFSVRQHNKIAIWLDKNGKDNIQLIAKKFREIVPVEGQIIYQSHDNSLDPIIC